MILRLSVLWLRVPAVGITDNLETFTIGNEQIQASDSARNIGAILDSTLTLTEHVNSITRACYFHLHRVKQIRPYLTVASLPHLYALSSSHNLTMPIVFFMVYIFLNKLQMVQNNAARLALKKKKSDHVTPLMALHQTTHRVQNQPHNIQGVTWASPLLH